MFYIIEIDVFKDSIGYIGNTFYTHTTLYNLTMLT